MPLAKTAFDLQPSDDLESNQQDPNENTEAAQKKPEPDDEEDVEVIDEESEGDDDEGEDGNDPADDGAKQGSQKRDSTVDKIIERHKGDPEAIAREFAALSKTYGKHAQELGELRKAIQEMREAGTTASPTKEPDQPAQEKPRVGERGFQLDDLGIEYIPPEYWKKDYVEQVKQYLLDNYSDIDEAEALQRAVSYAAQKRHEWTVDYEEQRRAAVVKFAEDQRKSIDSLVEKQTARIAEVDEELRKNANLVVPAGKEAHFVRTVKAEAAKVVSELRSSGSINDVEAASPEIVQGVYEMALGRLILSGKIGQTLTSDNGVSMPAVSAAGDSGGKPPRQKIRATPREIELARALGISVAEVVAERE